MPNWKKVIVSGSNAILNNITSSGDISASGDIYATNFYGNLEGTASVSTTSSYSNTISISNDFNNRIITANGNSTLNAEQNLSFNGSTLELTGSLTIDANNPITIRGQAGNVITVTNEGSTDIVKIGDVNLNSGETLITINDNTNTITLDASNKLDINANIDVSNYNITASIISASSFIGNLTGTSTLASNLTGTPSIIVNNITASGNISASGDLYSTHVFIPQGIITADAGLIFGDTIAGNSGYIADNDGSLVIGYNDSDKLSISDNNEALTLAGNTRITGHITASKNVSVSGDLIVGGNITANQYIVSSSVTYMTQSFSSGSTVFGDTLDDTHQFTGSVDITGSLSIPGFTDVSASLASKGNTNTTGTPSDNQIAVWTNSNTIEGTSDFTFDAGALIVEGGGTTIFNNQNDDATFQIKGSSDDNLLQVNPQSGDKVGIGTLTPSEKLTVEGNISASGNIIGNSLSLSTNPTISGSVGDSIIDISLSGDETYKLGVIKREFNFDDPANINDKEIATLNTNNFVKGIFQLEIKAKGYNIENGNTPTTNTSSLEQKIYINRDTEPAYVVDIQGDPELYTIYYPNVFTQNEYNNFYQDEPYMDYDEVEGKLKLNFTQTVGANNFYSNSDTTVIVKYEIYNI